MCGCVVWHACVCACHKGRIESLRLSTRCQRTHIHRASLTFHSLSFIIRLTLEVLTVAQAAECIHKSYDVSAERAIFNGLMISGQPGRHRIGTIGVTKLVKYYTAVALAVLLRVCMLYVLIILAV